MTNRKVALVTAAAGAGIGAAISRQLAEDGFAVVITDAHERRCGELAAELGKKYGREFLSLPLDVTNFEAVGIVVEEVLKQYGRLDVLVNNAGWYHLSQGLDLSDKEWQDNLDINLFSVIRCSRLAVPLMQKQKWGRIVNISSIFGKQPNAGLIDYNSTKAAVISLTKTLADELAKENILVNAVCPGPTRTPLWDGLAKTFNPDDPDGMINDFAAANIPLGRFGRPEEIADLVAFLSSERASFITGAAYDIDGGMVKNMA